MTKRGQKVLRSVVECFAQGVVIADFGRGRYWAYGRDPDSRITIGKPPPVDTHEATSIDVASGSRKGP